ncbi:HAL/PAL/TAL family ammonia-lyase [Candidatus Uabimicrobium amorphum]|uniref:Histidine ammonia-lyase n=1 Tax=Uabimicrobium amorphum TaxID=2596890 RepID=A0A5S9IP82_UABAM|nr:aromatic amino acid ammonia-lyase [Candidatus Uabimicrobium amorphum]BBM85161.1 histidine ammonia-lyase [Candidatus Uabimicrobium amorphum]
MVVVKDENVALNDVVKVAHGKDVLELHNGHQYVEKIKTNALFLQEQIKKNIPVYGTTTGFGDSCREFVGESFAKTLQQNLIRYHQCGTGEPFSDQQAIAIMAARLISLAKGHSGIRYELLQNLQQLISKRVIPYIPQQGSVGASGDLTPLAYIAAVMEGSGRVIENGKVVPAQEVLRNRNITPMELFPKEGLAIINGTSVMTGVLALSLYKIRRLCSIAEKLTAICIQVLSGKREAFDKRIHNVKPFRGQIYTARRIDNDLEGSTFLTDYRQEAAQNLKENRKQLLPFAIQNVYSLRCAPQIIGVVRDSLAIAEKWTEIELNSVTDNPLIFHEEETILLGGNFYGGYIAQAADSMKIAVSHLADLADKQMALLVDEKLSQMLPANLVRSNSGINHGFKGMQITVSALTAEVLRNTTAASIFSRVTENNNQDKVSMGTIAARDLDHIATLIAKILAIQSLAAAQAIDIRGQHGISSNSLDFYRQIRNVSPVLEDDRPMDFEINAVADFLLAGYEDG